MLKGAIFDFDGTLFDSMFIWDTAGEVYLRSVNREPQPDLQKVLRTMSLPQSAAYIRETYTLALPVEAIMAGINRTVEDFYFHTVQPKDGVLAFLEQLHAHGIKMCIATASDRHHVAAALRRCSMEHFFSAILTCTDVGHGKDEPVIFRKAMAYLRTTRADTLVFEDACHAVQTAKADGFRTVAVYDAYEEKQEELRSLADFFLPDYRDTDLFWKFASEE